MTDYFEIDDHKFDNSIMDNIEFLDMKTSLLNIETGFDLCENKDTGIIYPKNICEGTECTIKMRKKCEENEIYVGNFHTHPGGSLASFTDLINFYVYGIGIISGYKLVFYIRTIKYNKKSYLFLHKFYNKYKNYTKKHGKLNKELLNEKRTIYNSLIKTAFSVTEIIE